MPVAALPKAQVFSYSLEGILGSFPSREMDTCLLLVLFVVHLEACTTGRFLLSVCVCVCVWVFVSLSVFRYISKPLHLG